MLKINYIPKLEASETNSFTKFTDDLLIDIAEELKLAPKTRERKDYENAIFVKLKLTPLFWNESPLLSEKLRDRLYYSLMPKIPVQIIYLDSGMINECCNRLAEANDGCIFLGVYAPLQKIDTKSWKDCKNIKTVACVLNTAPRDGSHWTAFVLKNNKKCYFFDSLGMKPNKAVEDLITQTTDFLLPDMANIDIYFNPKTVQSNSTHCGYYVISFIEFMFKNEDSDMKEWRKLGYNDKSILYVKRDLFNQVE
jgi:hypothetical protein